METLFMGDPNYRPDKKVVKEYLEATEGVECVSGALSAARHSIKEYHLGNDAFDILYWREFRDWTLGVIDGIAHAKRQK